MNASRAELLSRRQQQATAVIVIVLLVFMAIGWTAERTRRGRPVNIERPYTTAAPRFRVDLNTADWPELTTLPEISETKARRIVEFRSAHGKFHSKEQIQDVKGIGPRTYERIASFLLDIPPVAEPLQTAE